MSTHTDTTDFYATSVADEQDAANAAVFSASGGDWDDLVDQATSL